MGKWRMVRLRDVATISAGQGAPQGTENYTDSGLPFIKAGSLVDLIAGNEESAIKRINKEIAKTYRLKTFAKDTIIFAKSGMSCMKGYVYQIKNDCYVVNHLACITPNIQYLSSKYLKYWFIKEPPNRLIKDSSYPSISLNDISNIELALPSLPIQQKIADALDKASALIEMRKAQIEKLDLLIKSQFIEMFGDPVTNPKGWEIGAIRDLVSDVKYGTSKAADENGKYIYLRMNNVTYSGNIDLTDLKYINVADDDYEKYVVRKGDVLFNRTNSKELVGKTAVFKEDTPMIIAGYLIRIRTNDKANPEYISAFLNSTYGKKTLYDMCKSIVGQANINAQELQNIKIAITPIELQNDFALYVKQTSQQKELLKSSFECLEKNYKALMQKCFSGEIF